MFDVAMVLLAVVLLLALVRGLFRAFRPMLPPSETGEDVDQSDAQRALDRDFRG